MPGDVDPGYKVEEVRGKEADQHRVPLRACKRSHEMGARVPEDQEEEERKKGVERRPGPVEEVVTSRDEREEKVELDDQRKEPEVVGGCPEEEGFRHAQEVVREEG